MIINAIIRLLLIFKYYRIAGNFDFGKLEIFLWLADFNLANWWARVIEHVHSG